MSATTTQLQAEKREKTGKGAARELRRNGRVPAIIYGNKQPTVQISLSEHDISQVFMKGNFYSRLLTLALKGENLTVLPYGVELNPVSDRIEHVDFYRVTKGATVRVSIPVVFHNKLQSPGLKKGGVLNIVRREVELECNAEKIPESLHVDLTGLNIGDSVHIKDIKLPEGAIPTIKRNFTIASIAGRTAEEETPVATAAVAAVAVEGAAAPTPGAEPTAAAEGTTAAPTAGKDAGGKGKDSGKGK